MGPVQSIDRVVLEDIGSGKVCLGGGMA